MKEPWEHIGRARRVSNRRVTAASRRQATAVDFASALSTCGAWQTRMDGARRVHMGESATKGGLSVHRTEALTDGIFAVAMTLLVIELKLPERETIHGAEVGHHRHAASSGLSRRPRAHGGVHVQETSRCRNDPPHQRAARESPRFQESPGDMPIPPFERRAAR